LSNSWQISFDGSHLAGDRNSFTLSLAKSDSLSDSAETASGHSLFRKLLLHVDVNRNAETDQLHASYEHAEAQVYD